MVVPMPSGPVANGRPRSDPVLERSFTGHKDVVTGVAIKPDLTQVASGSLDHSVMVWNFKPQLRAFRLTGHKAPVTAVDFSPSGHLLASASRDKTVRLWTPNVRGQAVTFQAHTSPVRTVQFSKDGASLLTSSDDKTIKLWTVERTKFQFTLAGHLNWVRTARFCPVSKLVVSGSDDKTVKLWDLRNKDCIKTYWDHTGMVTSVAFHPQGNVVASSSSDGSIKLLDIRTHKLIQHYGDAHAPSSSRNAPHTANAMQGATGGVNSIAFGGEQGEWLASTGSDGVVKIWDLVEGHLFYTLHGHKNGPTTCATFSLSGDFFATGGSDAQIMVWKSNFNRLSAAPMQPSAESSQPLDGQQDESVQTPDPGPPVTKLFPVPTTDRKSFSKPLYLQDPLDASFRANSIQSSSFRDTSPVPYSRTPRAPPSRAEPFRRTELHSLDRLDARIRPSSLADRSQGSGFPSRRVSPSRDESHSRVLSPSRKASPSRGISPARGVSPSRANRYTQSEEGSTSFASVRALDPESRQPSPHREPSYGSPSASPSASGDDLGPSSAHHALTQVLHQVNALTQTMSLLEDRLSSNEERVLDMNSKLGLLLSSFSRLESRFDQ